jgi:hypothetical protein
VGVAVVADPAAIGALRLDTASPDPSYRQLLRDCFFGDAGTDVADAAIGLLAPDSLTTVHTLDSSHSPFLSMPGELAGIIRKL